ncbi:Olfactory receptor 7A10 [Fukomys damarensis]|uniref:Olfactory receptor 7A10 n=1 Tax=Fukomys damarensis TaxID=885580 RepID=A0A091D9T4_FUKDA|nr:Olfactory receptor 7A10 [Fukomys damarensis]
MGPWLGLYNLEAVVWLGFCLEFVGICPWCLGRSDALACVPALLLSGFFSLNVAISSCSGRQASDMKRENHTNASQFSLLGLSDDPVLQCFLFGLFLSMYLLRNLLIILAISSDSHLHTLMYFLLSNLSFVDICFTSTTIPKMLVNIQTYNKVLSPLVRMSSSTSRYRAFSTCGSHLCVVSLFYGTGLGVYLSSAVTHSSSEGSVASVMYTVVAPC